MDSTQEHAPSYYAATVNDVTDYPVLQGAKRADVCIIGAGFTGVSAALALAERGFSVAIVEANRVGWGASGRNGGQLIHGFSGAAKIRKKYGPAVDATVEDMRWRGNDLVRERISRYGIQCDLKDGYVEVATKPRQLRWFDEFAAVRERHGRGHRYEIWDRDKTRDMLGTDAFHGGFVCYHDGHLHPLNLCIGEARAAESLGAAIFEHSPVTGIEHGRRATVKTADGSVTADHVLIAGNAYSRLERRHLSNLVFPAGSYMIATEPLGDETATAINRKDVAVCDLNEVVDYYRLSADKRLLYGGACNYSGRDPASIKAYILPRLLRIYPQLRDVRIEFEWGGKIGIVLRRIPTVGRIDSNVWYCQGYSGHGVCASHAFGEIMADAIGGTLERYDLVAGMKQVRIPGTQWFGNQIIALGMLYFKLKDRL